VAITTCCSPHLEDGRASWSRFPAGADACERAADDRVLADVQQRLADELGAAASAIHVDVHRGVVTLTGVVTDEWQKYRAEKAVYTVAEVERVENLILVIGSPANPRAM
jgi:osmotically-inducible protein OsmY